MLQAPSFTQWRSVRGPYYLGVGSISGSLSLLLDIASSASCLLNVLELALVPTTFLNLGLIEVVEDFVERQSRAEDERQGRAEDDTPYAVDAPQ